MNRREFIRGSVFLGAALGTAPLNAHAVILVPKRVLVLGGTSFLGPALVDALLASGHTVTLFNRGVTNPELFPHIEKLRGFRSGDVDDQDLSTLLRRRFDVVVDVWPNEPDVVTTAAEMLKDRSNHYLYVSSVGAFDHRGFAKPGSLTEEAPMEPFNSGWRAYNRNKAESERRLHKIVGERLTIVRPGPIAGHRDGGGDFLTWLLRAQDGLRHIAPGSGAEPVQFVDVKDVAAFLVMAINQSTFGTYSLVGDTMSFTEFLARCSGATGSRAEFVWIPQKFLEEHGLESNDVLHTFVGNFPYWLPDPNYQGLYRISNAKALHTGWSPRPLKETAFDCLRDYYSGEVSDEISPMSRQQEEEVLAAWERSSSR